MAPNPEVQARIEIDELFPAAGRYVCDIKELNLSAHRGTAVREFPLPGHGVADHSLYIDGQADVRAFLGLDLGSAHTSSIKAVQVLPEEGIKADLTIKENLKTFCHLRLAPAKQAWMQRQSTAGEYDAKGIIAQVCRLKCTDALDRFWPHTTAEHICEAESYEDVDGQERYGLIEIILDLHTLVERH